MGTITLGLLDIGSLVAGYIFAKVAPKVVTACKGDDKHDVASVTDLVTKIEAKLTEIKAAL